MRADHGQDAIREEEVDAWGNRSQDAIREENMSGFFFNSTTEWILVGDSFKSRRRRPVHTRETDERSFAVSGNRCVNLRGRSPTRIESQSP